MILLIYVYDGVVPQQSGTNILCIQYVLEERINISVTILHTAAERDRTPTAESIYNVHTQYTVYAKNTPQIYRYSVYNFLKIYK